jgi:hypothetical protein
MTKAAGQSEITVGPILLVRTRDRRAEQAAVFRALWRGLAKAGPRRTGHDPRTTWFKVENPQYSQAEGRGDLFNRPRRG